MKVVSREDWRVNSYLSGTVTVQDQTNPDIWLYIFGPGLPDDDERDRIRHEYARLLAGFLNGGLRPAFLKDMERTSESYLKGVDGSSISACGPMYDKHPPKCWWVQKEDLVSKRRRAALIDLLAT